MARSSACCDTVCARWERKRVTRARAPILGARGARTSTYRANGADARVQTLCCATLRKRCAT
eukprot:11167530-Lingulodinium_polyedra.AAC.1